MTNQYRLHYAPDNASLIIRQVLYELDQPFDTVLVNRAIREQDGPAYRALNPNGLIPVLETPNGPIFETAAILLWLADRHTALAPSVADPSRGRFLKWLFFLSNTLHAEMRMLFYPGQYIGDDPRLQADLRTHRHITLKRHLAKLDELKGENNYLLGAELSVADFYLCALIRWLGLFPAGQTDWFDLGAFPNLHSLALRLEQRKSTLQAAQAEGLGVTPFSSPQHANPPEGSAT